ncbi:MAG TPA: hypothetical protein VJ890_03330 [Vineibacter sp.]|nr:hypothetical protein [Vineibacter sp.]
MADRSMISARFGVEGDQDVERALRKVEQAGNDLAAALKKAGEQGSIDLKKVEAALKNVEDQAGKTASKGKELADSLAGGSQKAEQGFAGLSTKGLILGTTIGGVLSQGVTFAAQQLQQLVGQVHGAWEAFKDLSEQTGLTIAQVQALREVVKGEGADVDQLGKAIVAFSRNLGQAAEGNKRAADAFDRLGVNIFNADGSVRNVNKALLDTLQALSRFEDAATRNALGSAVMTGAWIKVADAFKNGESAVVAAGDALRKNGGEISEETQKKLEALNKAVNAGSEAWKGFAINLVAEVSPALVLIVKDVEQATSKFGALLGLIARLGTAGGFAIDLGLALGRGVAGGGASDSFGPPRPTGSDRPLGMQLGDLDRELADSLRTHRGETIDSARIRREIDKVKAALVARAAEEARQEMIRAGGDPSLFPLGPPPNWQAPGTLPKERAGGGGRDTTAREYERAKKALDDYLESLAREADLSDESARERAGHTAQLKAEALARAEVLKLSEAEIRQKGDAARALAEESFDRKQAVEEQKKAAQQSAREMERLAEEEARLLRQPVERALQETYDLATDLWRDALKGNITSWDGMWRRLKDIAIDYVAQIATLMVIRPLIQPIFAAAGAGGLMPGFGGAGSMSIGGMPVGGGGGGFGGFGGGGIGGFGGGDLFGGFFGRQLYGPAGGMFGGLSAASFEGVIPGMSGSAAQSYFANLMGGGVTVGNALAGIGSIASGAMGLFGGGQTTIGKIGSGLQIAGGIASFIPGGQIIGMALGLIGGLMGAFGKKKPVNPQEVSNITFGLDGSITNAIGMSRGKSLGTTGKAATAFGDVFGDLLDLYGLSTAPGFQGGYILNSQGKKTGNQFIVGLGQYGGSRGIGFGATEIAAGLGSAEEAINVLAGALAKKGAQAGTLLGLTGTQQRALSFADLKSIDEIKQALDFSDVYDKLVRGPNSATAAEEAIEGLNKQFRALKAQAKDYGFDVGIIDTRRQEALNKVAVDFNDNSRRRLLSLTPEGALQLALEDHDKALEQARREAIEINKHVVGGTLADINEMERAHAAERVRIIESANEAANTALETIWKRLSFGDLSGAPPLAALSGATATADALYAQAQAGSLTARGQLPAALQDLFAAQLGFTGNNQDYEQLRQLWLQRLEPFVAGNFNGMPAANDGGLLVQTQAQVATLVQQNTMLIGELSELRREMKNLLGRM